MLKMGGITLTWLWRGINPAIWSYEDNGIVIYYAIFLMLYTSYGNKLMFGVKIKKNKKTLKFKLKIKKKNPILEMTSSSKIILNVF